MSNWGKKLIYAITEGSLVKVNTLLSERETHDYDIEFRDLTFRRTGFLWAAVDGKMEIMQALMDANADTTATDKWQRGAIHLASKENHIAALDFLIRNGADVAAIEDYGRQPLHLAALKGAVAAIEVLLKHPNVEIQAQDQYERTPLHLAAKDNQVQALQFLLKKDADVLARDNYGRQPHHLAAMHGATDTLQILLERPELNVNEEDTFHHTALYLARYHNRGQTEALLLNYDACE